MAFDIYTKDSRATKILTDAYGAPDTSEPVIFAFLNVEGSRLPSHTPMNKIEIKASDSGDLLFPRKGVTI